MARTGIVSVPGCPPRLTEPEVRSEAPLVGIDGNAFNVMGTVQRGLHRAGADSAYVDEVLDTMQDGEYDHLLAVATHFTTNGGIGGPEGAPMSGIADDE